MPQTMRTGEIPVQKKRISVSQKRQITIPVDFFNAVGVENEVDCYVKNNAIVIRPVREGGGEFDEEILADLIAQGLSGNELLVKFKETRRKVRPAVESLLNESALAVEGKTSCSTYRDVFGSESTPPKEAE